MSEPSAGHEGGRQGERDGDHSAAQHGESHGGGTAVHHHAQVDKGLSANSVGLLGGTVLGISSVAPAYALTATIGLVVAVAGVKMPIIFIAGFLPMFFAAYAYREFNKVDPDCGTSFTWTTRAFGPYVGWLGGWVAILATIIVLANLAGIGVQFLYQLLGSVFGNPDLGDLWAEQARQRADLPGVPGASRPSWPTAASPPPRRCSSSSSSSSWRCWRCSW